jgi:hypothetical protein
MAISGQLDLFEETGVDLSERPTVRTTVRLGQHAAKPNLAKKRLEALKAFMELLEELEGKNIYVGFCGGSRSHFWFDKIRLGKLHAEWFGEKEHPGVIVLRGSHGASVRIFCAQVYSLRRQDYGKYTLWLLDFWNGFGEYPINQYHPSGYTSLDITIRSCTPGIPGNDQLRRKESK